VLVLAEGGGGEGARKLMVSRWLEERWEVFLPALAALGGGQEEQIKQLCEREVEGWRERPSLKKANSLRTPFTQTRNRIRETLVVTQENGWIDPKSGCREHLALKYLNCPEAEWIQMNLLSEEKQRGRTPLMLPNPSLVVSVAERLLQMQSWPEMVVGLGLVTGRGLVEVLKTGEFREKSAYAVWFAGPMTIAEQMCEPFEVPILVHASVVMEALERLRTFFGNAFRWVDRRAISQQCSEAVRNAIYRHLLSVIPLRVGENAYQQLSRGVYPCVATWYYCPEWVDEIVYMATIQNHRKILDASSSELRVSLALASGYHAYQVGEAHGEAKQRRGIRLKDPVVEVLSIFQEKRRTEERAEGEQGGDHDDALSLIQGEDHRALHPVLVFGEQPGRVWCQQGRPLLTFEQLHVSAETQAMLREAMALTGECDLLSYLLAAGEREARRLCGLERRKDRDRYARMLTSHLVGMKAPEAGDERYRRAVYTLMQWNETHCTDERWSVTTLSIQKLVGGRKDAIKAYLKAHHEEVEEHHRRFSIKPCSKRKTKPVDQLITIPEDPAAFPWGLSVGG
jgi:hypothetical protein